MGFYLNSRKPYANYMETVNSTYFVDKSALLEKLIPIVQKSELSVASDKVRSNKYICITRPRRFGKTVMANMIASFFNSGVDSREIFHNLKISRKIQIENYVNQHNVIYISFNEMPRNCTTFGQYIDRIQNRILKDLQKAFPNVEIADGDAVWDAFNSVFELENVRFVFVMDEWDFIFHRNFITKEDKVSYIDFLSGMLKDQPYVELAYMTGILPIAKYSSGSELNMFWEYTMASEEMFSDYFGFTESEVDTLYEKYLEKQNNPKISRDELRIWYNGYHTVSGERVYNPRSVVAALTNNNLGNYWTSAGPYDEIFYYIEHNVDAVRDDLALMVLGKEVPCKVREYAATSMNLTTKDEIFSAMVVYGFLSYENECVSIPNKELMGKFDDMLRKEASLGYIHQLAKESDRVLKATLEGDTDTICQVLEHTHNTEIPLLNYNHETDLTAIVMLAYLSARDKYYMNREDKGGIGYVDFTLIPDNPKEDGIIIELKVDHTADEAINQIKEKKYELRFEGKLGEKTKYTGRIIAVGIAYHRSDKKHSCKIEILRDAL